MEKELIKDIIQWDSENWSQPLLFWGERLSSENKALKCLELGCREGGLSLWLALKGYSVVSSDLEKTEMVAKPLHQKYNLQDKIIYQDINATSIPYENYFDIIIFKSILGGIGRNNNLKMQQEVILQIHKALKPGGKFLFAENTRATILHRFFRKTFTKWGSTWRYITISEMKEFLTVFSSIETKTTGFAGVFGRTENQKRFLGKIDRYFFNYIFPSTWKYIYYGVAKK